jgi:hypothetical protein
MEMTEYAPGTPSWVDVGSPDPAGAAAFYGALFGWASEEGPPEAGGYRMCLLRGLPVAGIGPQMNVDVPPYWASYVTVADADASLARAVELGGTVLMPAMDVLDVGRMGILADPQGAVVSVWEPRAHKGAGLVDEPGAFAWNELLTTDVAGASAFYGELFGWEARASEGDMDYTEFLLEGRSIAGMMPRPEGMPAEAPPMWLVYFAVEDCDAAVARVQELGGVLHLPPMDIPPGRFAMVADPHGAVFYVMRLAEGLGG